MPRFYCPALLAPGLTLDLPDAVAHHLHVLRLQAGEEITLFDGRGGQYQARLDSLDKRRASATLVAHDSREAELAYPVTLAQALPEASKMDWIIEKAVELGAAALQPLAAQRSVVRLSAERADKRMAHWQGVIVAASEQCGRNRLAQLAPLQDAARWMAQPGAGTRILLSPRGSASLSGWARAHAPHPVTFMIGPEGGFTAQEEAVAVAHGATLLTMGARVLRTETAGLAALAALNALWQPD